jgi:hypothetical protein
MNFLEKVVNKLLVVCASGRIPRPGKLFRVSPLFVNLLAIHEHPCMDFQGCYCKRFLIEPRDKATFLILKVQEGPLWNQWIQVLFCRQKLNKNDEFFVGWLSYLEFSKVVLAEWDKWDGEENQ